MCETCGHPNDPEGHRRAGHHGAETEYQEASRPAETAIVHVYRRIDENGHEVEPVDLVICSEGRCFNPRAEHATVTFGPKP